MPTVVVETGMGNTVAKVGGDRVTCEGGDVPPGTEALLLSQPEEITVGEGPYQAVLQTGEYLGNR